MSKPSISRFDRVVGVHSETSADERRRRRLLGFIVAFTFPLLLIGAVHSFLSSVSVKPGLGIGSIAMVELAALAALRHERGVWRSTAIIGVGAMVCITGIASLDFNFYAPLLLWLSGIPLMAFFVAGPRLGMALSGLGFVIVTTFFVISMQEQAFDVTLLEGQYFLVARYLTLAGLILFVSLFALRYDKERSAAMQSVLKAQEDFRSLVEESPEGIALVHDGLIAYANPGLAVLLGFSSAKELIGRALLELAIPDQRGELSSALSSSQAIVDLEHQGVHFLHEDGSTIPLSIKTVGAVSFGDKEGTMLLMHDLSQRIRYEAQLRVTDRLASVGSLAAGMAHEINNPIAFIQGNIEYVEEMLEEQEGIRERDEILAALKETRVGALRVAGLVRDLQSLARIRPEEARIIDLSNVLRDAIKLTSFELRNRTTLKEDIADDIWVFADAPSLNQVFINLLTNAADAQKGRPSSENTIRITCSRSARRATIEIQDNGPGIPEADLVRVFDPFYTTKDVGEGTGLGLPTCKKLINSMGGELTLENQRGGGLMARIVLPIQKEGLDDTHDSGALPSLRSGDKPRQVH